MRLKQPFLQLPRRFCAETLAAEVRALPPSAWVPHPGNYAGNDAVLLITPGGQMTNAFAGPMAPTEHLAKCPYIMEVMAEIGAVWGRSRLMGLAPGADVPAHVDINYHWRTHLRVHVPVITTPKVVFTCGGDKVHMAPGECWIFDSFRMHGVHNGGSEKRVHLVLDTVGGEELWDLIEEAEGAGPGAAPKDCPPGQRPTDTIAYERVNTPTIMSPWEVRCHIDFIHEHMVPDPRLDSAFKRLDKFAYAWIGAWARYGEAEAGIPHYQRLIAGVQRDIAALGGGEMKLRNQIPLSTELLELIFKVAVPQQRPKPVGFGAPQPLGARRLAS
ncbi:MAG TPA: aspartyl/asparaginyl beta-hydroxylase domain-containing protein [Allosphingosinicella sp.]|jgi:hypothetical protein